MSEQKPNSDQQSIDDDIIEPALFSPRAQKSAATTLKPSRKQWLIGTPLAIAVVALLFLLMSRSVTFISIPASDDIEVSGGLHVQLANAWLLFPGQYQVTVKHPGYVPLQETIEVGDEAEQLIRLQLQKLPGRLIVELQNTLEKAQVFIDGEALGETNTEIGGIKPGQRQLSVQHPRFLEYKQSLIIAGEDNLQTLSLKLEPAWAEVELSTTPAGANVSVGDELLGTTPGMFEILRGEQKLTLQLDGHKIWQENFVFNAGETLTLPTIKLQKADGLIKLATKPSGASVLANGSFVGQTPLTLALAPNQTHQLKFYKDGYHEKQTSLRTTSGAVRELSFELQPSLGKITVAANIADALLYVDNRLMGRANQTVQLPARSHSIRIEKDGFETFETEVTPRPEVSQRLDIKLRTLNQAKWDKIPASITTVVGQQLTLFKPNSQFTMGSSRREQGRRSNESLRSVSLSRAFYVSPLLVTNADYVKFERFHSSSHVKGNSLFSDEQPVVNISWEQAARFCNWLSAQQQLPVFYIEKGGAITGFNAQATGYRLPTEAEWAWLAREQGDNGSRKYPWGDQLPPTANSGNYGDRSAAALLGLVLQDYSDNYPVTSPVGKFAANGKGIFDIGGNAAEWINDYYGVGTGLGLALERDPVGPSKGDYHVIRGSSWAHGGMTELRLAYRDYGTEKRNDVGFRIARFVELSAPEAKAP